MVEIINVKYELSWFRNCMVFFLVGLVKFLRKLSDIGWGKFIL